MLRSLSTAVTGVKAHQTMLDVVGNNISNVNTTGFKKSTTVFQDILYQTSQGATAPGDGLGGVNAMQIGLGAVVAGVEAVNTDGPTEYTGTRTDMAISGGGYFVLDSTGNGNYLYTRAGNFSQDGDSNLVQVGTGYKVQGYTMSQSTTDPTEYVQDSSLSEIQLIVGSKLEANPTSVVAYRCNLNSEVDTYLPMGAPEVNGKIELSNGTYTVESTSSDDGTARETTNFVEYKFTNDAGVSVTVKFNLDSIKDGVPQLTSAYTDTELVAVFGGTTATTKATYDATSGTFKITKDSATLWETNILSTLDFNASEMKCDVTTPAASYDYEVLAEFNKASLDGSSALVTLWFYEPSIATDNPKKVQINVPLSVDGTFDIPEDGLDVNSLLADTAVTLPAPWNAAGRATLESSSSGLGFTIEAAKTMSDATTVTSTESTTLIQQNTDATHSTKISVYDSLGNEHTLEVAYKKIGDNEWRYEAYFPDEDELYSYKPSGTLKFGTDGKLISPSFVELNVPFSLTGASDSVIKLDFSGESFGYGDAIYGVTQYGSETTTKAYYQDGYAMGTMTDFSTGSDGTISGIYSNGKTIPLYKVALATFANTNGLERVGDTTFRESSNSGLAQIGVPSEGSAGTLSGGYLEMSNVDLTTEFTKMILAQRGFQANARVLTTSDSILEEVVNLKR